MKYPLIVWSLLIVFIAPQVSAESLFDKIKKKVDETIAKQEAKADQKIDQKIDETVDSAEKAVYEGETSTDHADRIEAAGLFRFSGWRLWSGNTQRDNGLRGRQRASIDGQCLT
jgi:hypothetical protein